MARPENNKNNAKTEAENKGSGKLKIIIASLVVIAIVAVSAAIIAGSLKKNPADATDPFLSVASDSKTADVSDPKVQALSSVHKTVFGTNSLEMHGSVAGNDINLIAQYGKDLLSSSVYYSFGKNTEAVLLDAKYLQYDGGDSVTVAYPAPLLSDSKNIVAAVRSDFISLFPDLSTTPQFYNVIGSDVNGSIQTAATAISNRYLDYESIASVFNSNKTVIAQFFFGTSYSGSMPDFDVLYKTAADFIINGLSEDSLTVTVSGSKKLLTYSIKGNMVSVTKDLIEYLKANPTAKLTLGNDFYEKLLTSLNAYIGKYTDSSSAAAAPADFSGTIVTEKGFISEINILDITLKTKNINSAKVSSSLSDQVDSRAQKKVEVKDKDSMLAFLQSSVVPKANQAKRNAQQSVQTAQTTKPQNP